ncbi:MAG: hypothetical protein FJ386_14810 [Verrucomicrobia bacterium]|nr:hypothetical protein [Verrucomicrobiota bacterium]
MKPTSAGANELHRAVFALHNARCRMIAILKAARHVAREEHAHHDFAAPEQRMRERGVGEEVEILEEAEHDEVRDDAQHEERAALPVRARGPVADPAATLSTHPAGPTLAA